MSGGSAQRLMRSVAVLPLSPSQRIVTIEVGEGPQRRWLVLGVTPQSITALHDMEAQGEAPLPSAAQGAPFAQLLGRLRAKGAANEA